MRWLTDPLSLSFLQRALVGGLLAAVSSGVVGTWVVLRRIAFFGDALGHGIVPGVAAAALLGVAPPVGAAVGAGVMVVGVSRVSRLRRLGEDAGIGLLFVGMLALGIIIISRSGTFAVDVTTLLFGAVMGVSTADLWLAGAAAVTAVTAAVVGHRAFVALAFDPRSAAVAGLRPRATQTALLGLVALTVVASFQTVGALLVFALLIAPPAASALVARRIPSMMALSVGLASLAVTGGLLASYHLDLATGGTIALWAVLQFFAVAAGRTLVVRWRGAATRGPGRTTTPGDGPDALATPARSATDEPTRTL